MRALEAALNEIWAMEQGWLESVLAIAARENAVTPEALEAYRAKSMDKAERATVRDGVAVLDVSGPLFKRANLFTAISGATSYDVLRRDFQAALDDPSVKSILLNVDSPGGAANGTAELAQAIFDARGKKPIVAYVGGMGASAAYWIATAADKIVIDPTALLGSIGVQMALRGDPPENDKTAKTYTFISSQSPMKNADPGTEEGAKGIQTTVDAMAQVFVETVARNRGTDTETVLKDFGKGGILVGKDAVQAGLADALGSFESVHAELSAGGASDRGKGHHRSKGTFMSETVDVAEAKGPSAADIAAEVAKAVTAAQAAERTRIAGLNRLAAAHGAEATELNAAVEAGTSIEAFALKLADAATAKAAGKLEALKKDEADAGKARPLTEAAGGEKTAEQVAGEIVAAHRLATGQTA